MLCDCQVDNMWRYNRMLLALVVTAWVSNIFIWIRGYSVRTGEADNLEATVDSAILAFQVFETSHNTAVVTKALLPNNTVPTSPSLTHRRQTKLLKRMDGKHYKAKTRTLLCGKYTCQLETGSRNLSDADMIIFNEHDVDRFPRPPVKNPKTPWAFMSCEPQNHIHFKFREMWDGLFNYSVTYLPNTEGSRYSFADAVHKKTNVARVNFATEYPNRPFSALWLVSHCLHRWKKHGVWSGRVPYVFELSKLMPVDVYTKENVCKQELGRLIKKKRGKDPQLSEYTFYLSFESTLCKDYISEKFWKVLESKGKTIPVVMGGLSIEEYEHIAPPNSFIHVKNFTSPKTLVAHLKYVAENDQAFNYYHEWRNFYYLENIKKGENGVGDSYCYFCQLAYEKPNRIWKTFSRDFSSQHCINVSEPSVYCSYYNLSCNAAT